MGADKRLFYGADARYLHGGCRLRHELCQKEEKTVLLRNDLASFAGRDLSRYLQYACAVGKHEILRFLPAGCYLHSSGYLHGDELSKENGKIT